jgi:hypothetical protein
MDVLVACPARATHMRWAAREATPNEKKPPNSTYILGKKKGKSSALSLYVLLV